MAQITALGGGMMQERKVRNLPPATQQSYVSAVAKFSRFFGCPPDRLGIEEVRAYQLSEVITTRLTRRVRPSRWKRMHKSASSMTSSVGSQPPTARKSARRKNMAWSAE